MWLKVKNDYFNVNLRVHLAQVVHDTVQVELSCAQDNMFSRFLHLKEKWSTYKHKYCQLLISAMAYLQWNYYALFSVMTVIWLSFSHVGKRNLYTELFFFFFTCVENEMH